MKKELFIAAFWIIVISCLVRFIGFANHNELTSIPNDKGHIAGFLVGIAHGFLMMVSMVVSIFNNKINIYEVHNTGAGYNAGFVVGVLLWGLSPIFFRRNKTIKNF